MKKHLLFQILFFGLIALWCTFQVLLTIQSAFFVYTEFEQVKQTHENTFNISIQTPEVKIIYAYISPQRFKGVYNQYENTLIINAALSHVPQHKQIEKLFQFLSFNQLNNINETLTHELAHVYMDQYAEQSINNSYPNFENESTFIGIQLVSEGIAEYVEHTLLNITMLNTILFPPPYQRKEIYRVGLSLVKPILDYDFHKGVAELMQNPPTEEELNDLSAYQDRILNKVSISSQYHVKTS